MLVRVRSKDGNFRFALEATDDVALLITKVLQETAPNADPTTLTFSNQPRGGEMDAQGLKGNTLADLGITHGHMLYADYKERAPAAETQSNGQSETTATASSSSTTPASSSRQPASTSRPWENVTEDQVDQYWNKRDGMIPRPKDTKFCRHGEKAMCDYCMPLEPYDPAYRQEHAIKHMSFHSYLKKLDVATNSSKPAQTYIPPLEEPNYSVRIPCPSGQHPSWPDGICTKCQPSAITLTSQEYRMVDHVEFSHSQHIENLLSFWRSTGAQRYGFLLGHYEPYDVVPMGIKAVVEAIHEPPQEGETDGLTLGVPWDDQQRVEELARSCGLQIVGQIYTDLTAADPTHTDPQLAGKVLCKRHKDSFFMSSLETIFAAQLQAANANASKFSMTGKYGSKFVTCVLSGTEEGAIDISAYQISEQGVGMVKSDMIEASISPNTIRVQPSEGKRYVPEVFHKYKNEYGIEIKESAKPTFPVEYLLITLTNGFPNQPSPRFLSTTTPFAVENRPGLHDQDVTKALLSIASAIGEEDLRPSESSGSGKGKAAEASADAFFARQKLVSTLSDWHLLAYLDTTDLVGKEEMSCIAKVATSHDEQEALDELLSRPGFQNLLEVARSTAKNNIQTNGNSHQSQGEVLGDYAGDDYIPPEAMEGYIPPAQQQDQQQRSQPSSKPSTTTTTTAQANPAPADEFTYTGSDDDEEQAEEEEEDDNMAYDDEDDEMFDDASSTFSGGATRTSTAAVPAPAQRPPASEDGGGGGGYRACPHCTFENPPGGAGGDCEVCGLPLSG
ncbi:unnamed protein product [Sympodiomycopsis kandeliae]